MQNVSYENKHVEGTHFHMIIHTQEDIVLTQAKGNSEVAYPFDTQVTLNWLECILVPAEAALLLVSTKNRDLWPGSTPDLARGRDSWC